MATWTVYNNLRVTYHHPKAQNGCVQELGHPTDPSKTKLDDILAWAAREGDGGDVIFTAKGVYFLQAQAEA